MKRYLLTAALLTPISLQAKFIIEPHEGYLEVIGCDSLENDECAYDSYLLKDTPLVPFSSKQRRFPGLDKAPEQILSAISGAAEAMGDVSYVHVAVTFKGTTYEYMFDRSTGWNSFRSFRAGMGCKLRCKHFPVEKSPG